MSVRVSSSEAGTHPNNRSLNGKWSDKLWVFSLGFDNDLLAEPGVFLSGTALTGGITLDIKKAMTIIRIVFKCEGHLQITDMKRELFHETRILQGQEKGRKAEKKTAPGRYRYPIQIQLPEDLPTTIHQTANCKVQYRCTVTLVRKTVADDITIERPFTVHQKNTELLRLVATNQNPENGSHGYSGIVVDSCIQKSGFFPGQTLSVSGTVVNKTGSSKKVKIGIELIRTVRGFGEKSMVVFSYPKHKQYTNTVASRWTDFLKAPKNGSVAFSHECALVNLEPSSKTDILEVEYSVKVISQMKGILSDETPHSNFFPIYLAPTLTPLVAYDPRASPAHQHQQHSLAHQLSQSSITTGVMGNQLSQSPMNGGVMGGASGSPYYHRPSFTQQGGDAGKTGPPAGGVGAGPSLPLYPVLPTAPGEEDLPPAYDAIEQA